MTRKNEEKRKFRSLKFTLAITFLTLSMAILLITSLLNIYFNIQTQRIQIDSQQQLIAKDAADSVKSFIVERFNKLENGARLSDLAVARQEEQKILLERIIGFDPAFRQVILLNASGEESIKVSRLSSFANSQLKDLLRDNSFLESAKQKEYISPVYIDEITSEPMVIISIPVKNMFSDLKGILMAEVNLKFMWDLVGSIKVGEEGEAYVVDNSGDLIAFGDISRVLKGENLMHIKEVTEFAQEDTASHEKKAEIAKGIKGNYVVTTHAHLGMPDWGVVVEIPVMEAYKEVVTELKLSILAIILSFLLAILAGTYFSKKISEPIKKLTSAVDEVSKGNFDVKIEESDVNEINTLADSLNRVMKTMKLAVLENSPAQTIKSDEPKVSQDMLAERGFIGKVQGKEPKKRKSWIKSLLSAIKKKGARK